MRGFYYGTGFDGAHMFLGLLCFLMMLVFAVIVITIIIKIVKHGSFQFRDFRQVPPELQELNMRLAKGKIAVEEYRIIREELLKQTSHCECPKKSN